MSVVTVYHDYFKDLVDNHPDLDVQNFMAIDLDTAFGEWREKITGQSFAFRLILPTMELNNPGGDARKHIQCGFYITHYHQKGKSSDYLEALGSTEDVLDDFIARMVYDSNTGHELFHYSLNREDDIEAVPTENVGTVSHSGWLCSFFIGPRFTKCIDPEDPGSSIWNDL